MLASHALVECTTTIGRAAGDGSSSKVNNHCFTVLTPCYGLSNLSRRTLSYALGWSGNAATPSRGHPRVRTLYHRHGFTAAPLQPRGTASVADLDMVRQCALEPTAPARPGHCTHLAHHLQRLHPLVRLSRVDRQPESMIQRFSCNAWLSDIHALCRPCSHVRGGMRRSKGDSLRMTCHMFYATCVPRGEHAERGWRM